MTTGLLASVGDPASTRTVYSIVVGLALIGVVLVGLGVWLIRRTRVDPELLGPLERMEERRWRKLDPVRRRRLLDEVRPEGAQPVTPVPPDPEVDSDFERSKPPVPSFDDLEAIGGATTTLDAATDELGPDAGTDSPDRPAADGGADADSPDQPAADTEAPVAGATAPVAGATVEARSGDDDLVAGDGAVDRAREPATVDEEAATVGERVGEPVASDDDR